MDGWIDEVSNGVVYGRLLERGKELRFSLPVLSVLEDQRVDLEPRRYVSFVNGHMLIDKTIWTTHDTETADRAAEALHRELFRDRTEPTA